MGDHKLSQSRFIELRRALVRDARSFGVPFNDHDLEVLLARNAKEGDKFVATILPQFGRHVDKSLISGIFQVTNLFRRKTPSVLPFFMYAPLSRIFHDDGRLRTDACQVTIQFVRQFLLLDSKLEGSTVYDEDAFISEFETQQFILGNRVDWKSIPLEILEEAQRFIAWTTRKLNNRHHLLEGRHGPGEVYEKVKKTQKWDFETWPKSAEIEFPFYLYGRPNCRISPQDKGVPLVSSETRIALVPKDFRGPRLISIESTAMQFLQQGMWREFAHVFSQSLISRSVRLEDQTFSRKFASKAIEHDLATVDLSAASDHVSAALVWKLFSGVPILRRRLFALRSSTAIWKGRKRIRLTCFAPMGSAICFPIETLVFLALSLAVMRWKDPKRSVRDHLNVLRVYGDDIVIPVAYVDSLIWVLQLCGMKVNTQKTCVGTPFRECCGGEWFGDKDVTVVRNKSFLYPDRLTLSNHSDICSLQRRFYTSGYVQTSTLLAAWAKEIWPTPVLEGTSGYEADGFLYGPAFSAEHCHTRFNQSYQRHEVRLPLACQAKEEWLGSERGRLMASLLSLSSDTVPIRSPRKRIRLGWRYVPCYMGISTLKQA